MKVIPVLVILLLAGVLASAGCTSQPVAPAVAAPTSAPAATDKTAEMAAVARDLSVSINAGLTGLKNGLRNNSAALSGMNLSGPEASGLLSENLLLYPWAVSSVIISRDGTVKAAVPKNYAGIIGMDLGTDTNFGQMNRTRAPLVSPVFRLAEGYDGIVQSYPIFSPSGDYLGYTGITYEPRAFLGRYAGTATSGSPYDVWIAQTDGTVIYDIHKEEIGTNILSDPGYADPGMRPAFLRIVKEPSGSGRYSFHDNNWNGTVTKTAVWDTAGIDGAAWRVVVTSTDSPATETVTTVPAGAGEATSAWYANLSRFVERAAAYAREKGKDAALMEFNKPDGSFIDGDLYIFAYEMNGTVIALPYQPDLLGTDRSGISDSNGVEFIRGLTDAARNGGGSLYYIYPNPGDNYRDEFKLSSVLPVDKNWFVGSGIYRPDLPATFNTTERDALVTRVKKAQRHAQVKGTAMAIADFNDPNGSFADGSRYIFAYGNNGTTLALPFQPELIGTNRLDYTDPYGVKALRWMDSVTKRGGGFVYLDYMNPDTGIAGLKLCYVAPVDDAWFVGSGIYTAGL